MKIKEVIEDIPILYINLNRAISRKNMMEKILSENNLNYERIEAIDGYLNSKNEHKQNYNFRKLTIGEIGCVLSHIKAIQTAIDKGYEYALIMEDDCCFEYLEYKDKSLKELMKINNDWDIIQLGIICDENILKIITDKKQELTRSHYYSLGAFSYLINRNGMNKIVDYFNKTKNIDRADDYVYKLCKTYITIPYFSQECTIFKSDVRLDDNLEFQINSKKIWDDYIKNINK